MLLETETNYEEVTTITQGKQNIWFPTVEFTLNFFFGISLTALFDLFLFMSQILTGTITELENSDIF